MQLVLQGSGAVLSCNMEVRRGSGTRRAEFDRCIPGTRMVSSRLWNKNNRERRTNSRALGSGNMAGMPLRMRGRVQYQPFVAVNSAISETTMACSVERPGNTTSPTVSATWRSANNVSALQKLR